MPYATLAAALAAGLILLRLAAELWLARLNARHVLKHADAVPAAFQDLIDPPAYAKSVEYTLAKSRLGQVEDAYRAAVLLGILFSGLLPRAFQFFTDRLGAPRSPPRRSCSPSASRWR